MGWVTFARSLAPKTGHFYFIEINTHQEQRGSKFYLFHNVPAQVCDACGEVWIEEKTLQKIDQLIEKGHPTRKVQTPLFDLAKA